MKLIHKLKNYILPGVGPDISRDIDRQSMRNIYYISLAVLIIETLTFIVFLISRVGSFDHEAFVSTVSVCYCIALCALAHCLSARILEKKEVSRKACLAFKLFFYITFMLWAIFVDFRHYRRAEQMLTFSAANLIMVCFVIFKPWLSIVLTGGAHLVFYLSLFAADRAEGIQIFNFIVLAVASIACEMVQYHHQLRVCTKEKKLSETNRLLEEASRRDGLTGLQNRLALEEDAKKMDGRPLTAYMIDINYFKEINDQYGHAAGDRILQEVSGVLGDLFPGGHYYRYGGDEFLVLTHKPAENNYGYFTYELKEQKYGVNALLSIGNAHGSPATYEELFDLISQADKALYIVKERTHSAEYGGYDRRKEKQKDPADMDDPQA